MKVFKPLLLLAFFCGLISSAYAQKSVFIGKVKDIASTYKGKSQRLNESTKTGAKIQISHLLPGNKSIILRLKSYKQEGAKETFFGEVYNIKSSRFNLEITGRGASGSIIMIEQKKFYRYSSTPDGSVYLTEEDIDNILCIGLPETQKTNYKLEQNTPSLPKTSQESSVAAAPPMLESLPGAGAVLYLDFDGQTVKNTQWNLAFTEGAPIVAEPSTLSQAEMTGVWKVMSEDFRPFAVNVTTNETVFNNAPNNRRMRIIFTPSQSWYPNNAGGVAYIGSFTWGETSFGEAPCWVWNTGTKYAGEAGSHEVGHTLNLGHDGRTSPEEEYFVGQNDWAPIMGVGYDRIQVQWSKGEYPFANNTENDLDKITTINGFGYRPDDHGNGITTATPLVFNTSGNALAADNKGIITTRTDYDVFSFTSNGGPLFISVNPDPDYPNLDIHLALRNSSGTIIATADPIVMAASLNVTLQAGTYYLTVDGVKGSLGANSDYCSIGAYSISTSTSTPTYCAPVYTEGCATYGTTVHNFSINTLVNNNSGCNDGTATGYSIYAPTGTLTTTMVKGQKYNMKMQTGSTNPMYFGVWIDYNGDRDFDDAGEFVYTSPSASANEFYTAITIPTTAAVGTTRMRVISNYSDALTATQFCSSMTWGEAEDYSITIVNAANQPPTVSITSPVSGASFTYPATINIAANAADADGSLAKVEFFQGTTKLGEDLTAPYTYSWSGVAAGNYSITAKATDNAGLSTTSNAVSVIVSSAAITTFRPSNGSSGVGVMIVGTKLSNVSAVRFNGIASTKIYAASPTLLYATVPTGATTGKIEVVTNGITVTSSSSFTVAGISSKWTKKTGLTSARLQHGTIAVGGKIYVFGGYSSSGHLKSLEIYSPSTNSWTAGAPLPVATRGMAFALGSNGSIYMFGGATTTNTTSSVYRYTPSTNTWKAMASMPVALFEAAAAATSNGKIYLFGGEPITAKTTSTNATRIYDIATNTWASGANMPVGVQQHSATTGKDGKIYVIGGRAFSANEPLGRVQIYNPTTNTWTSGATMPIPKVQFGLAKGGDGKIYVVGGKANEPNHIGPYFHTVEIYNPTTNSWANGPVLPQQIGQQTAINLNDDLYAIGGSDGSYRGYNFKLTIAPVVPTALTATAASTSQINLKWTDKSLNESSFVIERSTSSAGPFTAIGSVGSNVTAYANTGIAAGTTYFYRVKASNTAGSSAYSNVASVKTLSSTATLSSTTSAAINSNIIPEKDKNEGIRLSVYPNPAKVSTRISFTVVTTQRVNLGIYDTNGNLVEQIYSGTIEGGKTYQINWSPASKSSGIYISRLVTTTGVLAEKIIFLP